MYGAMVTPLVISTNWLAQKCEIRAFLSRNTCACTRCSYYGSSESFVFQEGVPGFGQITWRIVLIKQIERSLGNKITRKSRYSCWVSGGGVRAKGQLTRGSNELRPGTKYRC